MGVCVGGVSAPLVDHYHISPVGGRAGVKFCVHDIVKTRKGAVQNYRFEQEGGEEGEEGGGGGGENYSQSVKMIFFCPQSSSQQ